MERTRHPEPATPTAGQTFAGEHLVVRERFRHCDQLGGVLRTVGRQDTVRCAVCGAFLYNAPRWETGRGPRPLRTRTAISPSQSARILARDGFACVLCHRADVPLEVGHLLSVHDGQRLGVPEELLHDDVNLAAMCAEHNAGLGYSSIELRLFAALLFARDAQLRARSRVS